MKIVKRINKIIRNANSSEIDLAGNLKFSVNEILELNKSLKQNTDAAYFQLEYELVDSSEAEISAEMVDYIYGPRSSADLEYISDYCKKSFEVKKEIQEINKHLSSLNDQTLSELLANQNRLRELKNQKVSIEEHDLLLPIISTAEEYLEVMQTNFNQANNLLAKMPQVISSLEELEPFKPIMLEERESKLLSLSNITKENKSSLLTKEPKKITQLDKFFILSIVFVLLFGIFTLIVSVNILLTLLSLIVSGLIAGLYLFSKAIPSLPLILKAKETHTANTKQDNTVFQTDLELKVLELAKARKDQVLKEDIYSQLSIILEGNDLNSLKEQIENSMDFIKAFKEKVKQLEPFTRLDLLEINTNIDILSIDIQRARNEITAIDFDSSIMSKVNELDLLETLETELDKFSIIMESITGFKFLKKENNGLLVSKDADTWSSLDLTPRQVAQLSLIDSLEKRLKAEYNAPIIILNPKKLLNQRQQDLISKRVYDLLGTDTQLLFIDVV